MQNCIARCLQIWMVWQFRKEGDYARHVYHVYAIRAPNRDALINGLTKKGISCGIHYPLPYIFSMPIVS